MSEIAQELARRASPAWVKEQVKVKAVKRSSEMKEKVSGSPLALGTLGGTMGLLAGVTGGVMAAKRHGRAGEEEWEGRTYHAGPEYGSYVETPTAETGIYTSTQGDVNVEGIGIGGGEYGAAGAEFGTSGYAAGTENLESGYYQEGEHGGIAAKGGELKERLSHKGSELKHKGSELKERVGEKTGDMKWKAHERFDHARERASHMRERIPSRHEMKSRAQDNPSLLAAIGLAMGAIAGILLPVTRREERMLSGAKSRASTEVQKLGDKVSHKMEEVQEKLGASHEEENLEEQQEGSGFEVTGETFSNEGSYYGSSGIEPPSDTRH